MPWPQPGHQMWGSLPGRMVFFVIVSHVSLNLLDFVHDLAGIDRLAVDAAEVQNRAGALDHALDFEIHLPEVHFGNDDPLDLLAQFGDALLREGPEGDRAEQAGFDPFLAQFVDRITGAAGGRTVGEDQHFGVFGQILFVFLDVGTGDFALDLADLATLFGIDILGFGGRESHPGPYSGR